MAFEIGKIQTVVGTGEEGYAGDGSPATQARIGEAYGCDFDTQGNLYICDGRNHTIRRIDKDSGIIDRKSTRLNSSHSDRSRMPSSA